MIPQIGIVIVTWNNEKDIANCLDSLYRQSLTNYKVVLVDNHSTDQTLSIATEYDWVDILPQKENKYLTYSNNIGINYLLDKYNSESIMVLNPDTILEVNVLEILYSKLNNDEKIGAVGPKTLFMKDKAVINTVGLFYDGFMQCYDIGFEQEDMGQFDQDSKVFGLSGVCILYKTEVLKKVGLYLEPIKMYLDDLEMAIKINNAGYEIYCIPSAVIYHNLMQSTNQNKNFRREDQIMKAWLLIAWKHYSLRSKLAMLKKYFEYKFLKFRY